MEKWQLFIAALLGAGGIGGVLAYLAAPGSERLAFRRKDRDEIIKRLERLEKEAVESRTSIRFLTSGVTALQWHSDELRRALIKTDPSLVIPTAAEILSEVRANIDALDKD